MSKVSQTLSILSTVSPEVNERGFTLLPVLPERSTEEAQLFAGLAKLCAGRILPTPICLAGSDG